LLLDECVTRFVKRDLAGHEVNTVEEAGFKGLNNGDLLGAASGITMSSSPSIRTCPINKTSPD